MKSTFKLPEFKLGAPPLEASDPFTAPRDKRPGGAPGITFTPLPAFARPVPKRSGGGGSPFSTLPYIPGTTPKSFSTLPFTGQALDIQELNLPKDVVDVGRWTGHGTHITDGLDLNRGQKTAVDIMAKPGTVVPAPANGTVVRLGSAQGGDSMYFRDDQGHTWWLGHIDSRFSLKPGTRVRAGQALSRISADHAAPHLHLDRTL